MAVINDPVGLSLIESSRDQLSRSIPERKLKRQGDQRNLLLLLLLQTYSNSTDFVFPHQEPC